MEPAELTGKETPQFRIRASMERTVDKIDPKQNTPWRKVVVTGGLGFVGASVVSRLARLDSVGEVVILDRVTYAADVRRLKETLNTADMTLVRGDIRSPEDAHAALKNADAVIHLAAETHVPRSYLQPELFFDVNVAGTENLLRVAQETGVKHFIHGSSTAVYGPSKDLVSETSALRPMTPYAQSKAMAEEAVMQAADEGLVSTILRPSNAVGVDQHPEKLFPRFVMQALKGQRLTIEGAGLQQRAFLPVADLASAICTILNVSKPNPLGVYNVCGDECLSVKEVAQTVFRAAGIKTGLHYVRDRRHNDDASLVSDAEIRSLGYCQTGTVASELAAICERFRERAPPPAKPAASGVLTTNGPGIPEAGIIFFCLVTISREV